MNNVEILNALKENQTLLMMLATEIGEAGLVEDSESERTWADIGNAAVTYLLSCPMGRHS